MMNFLATTNKVSIRSSLAYVLVPIAVSGCQTVPVTEEIWPIPQEAEYTSRACPDISGRYYDYAIKATVIRKHSVAGSINFLKPFDAGKPYEGKTACQLSDSKILGECTLRYLLDSEYVKEPGVQYHPINIALQKGDKFNLCPERSIDFQRLGDSEFKIAHYKGDTVVSEFTFNAQCKSGKIVLHEEIESPKKYKRDEMYLNGEDLIRNKEVGYQDMFASVVIDANYLWSKLGTELNPYASCN